MPPEDVALVELLAALSVTTDLGMGKEPEKAVRACLLATALARASELPDRDVHDIFYSTLLQHLGCTAPSHEITAVAGDDVGFLRHAESTDDRNLREAAVLLAAVGRGSLRHLGRMLTAGQDSSRATLQAVCEVGARLAARLGLGEGVRRGLYHSTERWDGKTGAHGLAGDDIALAARFGAVASQAIVFDRLGGPDAAAEMVRRRAGGWFDPAVADAFLRVGPDVLRSLAEADVWAEVVAAEPPPPRRVPAARLDDVAAAFGDMVDLKTPFTLDHSSGVADLAGDAAAAVGLGADQVRDLRRAALLHDLGRVAVGNVIWEKETSLSTADWEQVRLHPYHTERILARAPLLAPLGEVAGRHHERVDGSGYHRGASGGELGLQARLLAVADTLQALTQDRPQRAALPPDRAAELVEEMAADGRFDPECARAVVAAAGQRPAQARGGWPAGLTDREVEVLRLVARGLSNQEVADALVVSRRTAEHHVQHIYAKIGVSTRAAAAMFGMEHGLLR